MRLTETTRGLWMWMMTVPMSGTRHRRSTSIPPRRRARRGIVTYASPSPAPGTGGSPRTSPGPMIWSPVSSWMRNVRRPSPRRRRYRRSSSTAAPRSTPRFFFDASPRGPCPERTRSSRSGGGTSGPGARFSRHPRRSDSFRL